jgi:lipocalin
MIEETFDDGSVSVIGCVTKSPANILNRDIIAMIEEMFDDGSVPTFGSPDKSYSNILSRDILRKWRRSTTMLVYPKGIGFS